MGLARRGAPVDSELDGQAGYDTPAVVLNGNAWVEGMTVLAGGVEGNGGIVEVSYTFPNVTLPANGTAVDLSFGGKVQQACGTQSTIWGSWPWGWSAFFSSSFFDGFLPNIPPAPCFLGTSCAVPFPNLYSGTPQHVVSRDIASQQVAQVKSEPQITGTNLVWWFNGMTPPGYATSVTLTSSGGAATIWGVVAGSDKVTLTPYGSTALVASSGTSFSAAVGDVAITAQANFVTSAPFHMTTRTPKDLVQPSSFTQCDANWGYDTTITYIVRDQFTDPMTGGNDHNEKWSTVVNQLYPNTNWQRGPEIPGYNPGQYLIDVIQGPGVNNIPTNIPQPTCNTTATEVQKWGQEWRVGSQTSGSGVLVQTDTFHRYNEHGAHTIP